MIQKCKNIFKKIALIIGNNFIPMKLDWKEFTKNNLEEKLGWNVKTVDKYLGEAISWSFFKITQPGGRGISYKYKLVKTVGAPIDLLTPEELAEEIKIEIPTLSSKSPLGIGHLKPLPVKEKPLNTQYTQ